MTSKNEQQPEQWSEAQVNDWVRSQFQKANLHLAEKGVVMDSVAVQDSRYLPPYVAVWKINALDKQSYWVICGDLPTDHIELKAAENARDALRAFSFRWQIKAQQLVDAGIEDQTATDYANLLVNRAQSLYQLFESEKVWG